MENQRCLCGSIEVGTEIVKQYPHRLDLLSREDAKPPLASPTILQDLTRVEGIA
jgi:hypothetical protein